MGLQPDHVHFRVALPLLIYPGMQLYCATSPWTFTTPYMGFSGSPHSGVSAKLYRYRWVDIKYFRVDKNNALFFIYFKISLISWALLKQ